jgi:hypothetical protein
MSELISLTSILTASGSGIGIPFINKLLGPGADEIGLMLGERIKMYRLRKQIELFYEAKKMLTEAGIEPKQVNLKTLLPLMEGASLEDDISISSKWAALLANAATENGDTIVEPSFADVLKQLTSTQCLLLDLIYKQIKGERLKSQEWALEPVRLQRIQERIGLDYAPFQQCVENLLRLRLCSETRVRRFDSFSDSSKGFYNVNPTLFGFAFYTACTAPKKITT